MVLRTFIPEKQLIFAPNNRAVDLGNLPVTGQRKKFLKSNILRRSSNPDTVIENETVTLSRIRILQNDLPAPFFAAPAGGILGVWPAACFFFLTGGLSS